MLVSVGSTGTIGLGSYGFSIGTNGDINIGTSSLRFLAGSGYSVISRSKFEIGTSGEISSSTVPFTVQGAASQSANLTEWKNSAGTVLSKVLAGGQISVGSNTAATIPCLDLIGYSSSDYDGFGGLRIGDGNTAVLTITRGPTNAFCLTASGRSLTVQNNVDGSTTCNIGAIQPVGGATKLYVTPYNAGQKGLVIQGASSQTANLQEWQNSAGTALAYINSAGNMLTASTVYLTDGNCYVRRAGDGYGEITGAFGTHISQGTTYRITVDTSVYLLAKTIVTDTSSAAVVLTVQGAASQSANLQEWKNSAGTALANIDASGIPYFKNSDGSSVRIVKGTANSPTTFFNSCNGAFSFQNDYTGAKCPVTSSRFIVDSAASVIPGFFGAGSLLASNYQYGFLSTSATNLGGTTTADTGLACAGAGIVKITNGSSGFGSLSLGCYSASTVGLTVQAAASQTANLQEWKISAGTVIGSISNVGSIAAFTSFTGPLFAGDSSVFGTSSANYFTDYANTVAYVQTATDSTHAWTLTNRTATKVALSIQAAVSQTANIQEWQNSAGSVMVGLKIGTGSTTFSLAEAQTIFNASSNQIYLRSGSLFLNDTGGTVGIGGVTTLTSPAAGSVPLIVVGAASQSANLFELRNSAGTAVALVSASGRLEIANDLQIGGSSSGQTLKWATDGNSISRNSGNGVMTLQCQNYTGASWLVSNAGGAAATTPLVVMGNVSQSANLQQWQNSSGVAQAAIGFDGGFKIKEQANGRAGQATLVGGTVTVSNTSVTSATRVRYWVSTAGGTQGFLSYTKVNSTSFTINSTSASETSVVDWELVEAL